MPWIVALLETKPEKGRLGGGSPRVMTTSLLVPEAAAPKPRRKCSSPRAVSACSEMRAEVTSLSRHSMVRLRLLHFLQLATDIVPGDILDDLCLAVIGVGRQGCQDRGTINLRSSLAAANS